MPFSTTLLESQIDKFPYSFFILIYVLSSHTILPRTSSIIDVAQILTSEVERYRTGGQ